MGKQTDMRNMDSQTVAQMMQRMNPQMLQHLGGQEGLSDLMKQLEAVRGPRTPSRTLPGMHPRHAHVEAGVPRVQAEKGMK